jgi:hypothetical protein
MLDYDTLTICPECGETHRIYGTEGIFPHVLRWHPHSDLATQIRVELNARASVSPRSPRTSAKTRGRVRPA